MSVKLLILVLLISGIHCKIYDRCELAKELKYKHKIPENELATWVCIAQYESTFNTAAVGHANGDGSGDHGLFQISDIYWCSPPNRGKGCNLVCSRLEDDDISDDVECVKRIYKEHQRLSGNGFTAWAVYHYYCKGKNFGNYLNDCFDGRNKIDSSFTAVNKFNEKYDHLKS